MNRLRLSLAILIALGFCGPATAKPVPPADPASRDRAAPPAPARFDRVGAAARLERIAELVARSNAPNLVGEQRWNELLSTFRPGLIGCSTHRQFAVVVNKLLHRAGVSHFRYYTDADWSYWHLRAAFGNSPAARRVAYIGLFPQRINNRWFVRGILEGTPADGSAIGVGDEILSVNGEPYSPIRSFEGTAGKPTTITLARMPGAAYSVTLTPATGSLYEAMQNA
ncbi:MAG: hypothetical protein ACE5EX_09580, partial [Phycisphaerae bacterium]